MVMLFYSEFELFKLLNGAYIGFTIAVVYYFSFSSPFLFLLAFSFLASRFSFSDTNFFLSILVYSR